MFGKLFKRTAQPPQEDKANSKETGNKKSPSSGSNRKSVSRPASNQKTRPKSKKENRRGATKATEEQKKKLLEYDGRVLTLDGDLKVSEAHRDVIAVLDDGTCLVEETDYLDPRILEVRNMAKSRDIIIRRELAVSQDFLRKFYVRAEKISSVERVSQVGDESKMRSDFLALIAESARIGASDIHMVVNRYEGVVSLRVDGDKESFRQLKPDYAMEMMVAAFNMSGVSDSSWKPYESQAARISEADATLPSGIQALRLQFNPLPNEGRQMVARLLYAQSAGDGKDIDALGYSKQHIRSIKAMRRRPQGLIVTSGPTGSGKSTTLMKALMALMEEKRHKISVQTIEDPVEYILDGAAQINISNAATDEDRRAAFNGAISAALRSDPDTIMIGEVRDSAAAKLAFEAAMTGHQVWTSLHANESYSIPDRLRDHGVEKYKLTDHRLLVGLIGQRLLKKLCKHCKIPIRDVIAMEDKRLIDEDLLHSLHNNIGEEHFDRIYMPDENGCEKCRMGFKGRTVAAETINPDLKFMEFIAKDDKIGAFNYWINELEGFTCLEHAVSKMLSGTVDPRSVEDKTDPINQIDPKRLDFLLKIADDNPEDD
ncbi:ATPase, T2SS/T4P/T4SS family [Sulfitobacter sp. R18_1]|uniref:GspE/PulE family protein n=1 Tax=Sulfitobacter sp. R18_1 TaxID=2821104 RepID=UPI001ADC134B|nr:ATPase, T2SS/T4P/T4SS family [Sulfitobacter sp. R18_1]MBO9428538.1 Flp pilus assembly complex ATPase component TadA [Sulfitobacter sp. R18_1]